MSLFGRIDQVAAGTLAAVMGDKWVLTPMRKPDDVNAAEEFDPDRPVQEVVAIYREPTAPPFIPNGFDPRSAQRPGVASGHPEIEMDPRLNAGAELKSPDLLREKSTGKTWRVMKTRNDEMGRIFAAVNLVG